MRDVLAGADRGETAPATAARLGLSIYTVHGLRAAARDRLDEPTTRQAAARARLDGLL
jgi:alkanesulfonate monooxygenase SsuD/methylene tetrahydromethanopterin reductase-like flavin-dependent oxidoreductase (luciferase family)